MILTFRYRVKDGACSTKRALRAQARAVNFVWNYCCQIDREAAKRWRAGMAAKRPSGFDLANLCRGMTKELGLHSDCIDAICARFTHARDACFPRTPRFRSFKRSLDWIPFSNFSRPAKLVEGVLSLMRRRYFLWFSRPIPDNGKMKSWNFSTDSRERWYCNIHVELPEPEKRGGESVGIDLGLNTLAMLSTGEKIEPPKFYRAAEEQLAKLQRHGLKTRARSLAAKVANQRRDFLHKTTTDIVRRFGYIAVGDVSSEKIAKTRMAKSVYDAGWSMFRQMLLYKAVALGAVVEVVFERNTSRACSHCGVIPVSSPKGMNALGIRHWVCSECGASHDRDVNAAWNILFAGRERLPLGEEIPVL